MITATVYKSKDISQGVVLEELVVTAFFVGFVGRTYDISCHEIMMELL